MGRGVNPESMTQVFNRNCMEAMREFPDKFFELAIVDPPYGIGEKLVNGGTWARERKSEYSEWDKVPNPEYFNELFRVSEHQIIWGGNYFDLPPCRCFIVWDKPQMRIPTMADCEFAWTSFDSVAKIASILQEKGKERIHLAQKPIALYKWLLKNYAKPGDKILDTHLGSGSSRIAADQMGFDFWGYELDKDYFEASVKRFNQYKAQTVLF